MRDLKERISQQLDPIMAVEWWRARCFCLESFLCFWLNICNARWFCVATQLRTLLNANVENEGICTTAASFGVVLAMCLIFVECPLGLLDGMLTSVTWAWRHGDAMWSCCWRKIHFAALRPAIEATNRKGIIWLSWEINISSCGPAFLSCSLCRLKPFVANRIQIALIHSVQGSVWNVGFSSSDVWFLRNYRAVLMCIAKGP